MTSGNEKTISEKTISVTYTDEDMRMANLYAAERLKLLQLEYLYEKFPHIATHLKYTIRAADKHKDYYFDETFREYAIKVDVEMTQSVCEKISCNFSTATGPCKKDSITKYYRIGDSETDFDLQCQPACFHLKPSKISYNRTDNAEVPQSIRTHWNERSKICAIVPQGFEWFEHPIYRSQERYEKRVNDLPVGFNRISTEYTASGFAYEYNKAYCDAFFDQWDPQTKSCTTPTHEVILNAVIGECIVKLAKSGVTHVVNTFFNAEADSNGENAEMVNGNAKSQPFAESQPFVGSTIQRPKFLHKEPPIEEIWKLDGWLNDINTDFIRPDVDFILSKGAAEKGVAEKRQNPDSIEEGDNNYHNTQAKSGAKYARGRPSLSAKGRVSRAAPSTADSLPKTKSFNFFQETKNIIIGILESTTKPEFWRDIGISTTVDAFLSVVKKIATDTYTKFLPYFIRALKTGSVFTRIYSETFRKALLLVTIKAVRQTLLIKISFTAMAVAKITANAVSIVGIVLMVIGILDLVLTMWDPLNFKQKYDQKALSEIAEQFENASRLNYGMAEPKITFDFLVCQLIDENIQLEMSAHLFKYVVQYLDSLKVNSDGSVIEKGSLLAIDGDNSFENNNIHDDMRQLIAKTKLHTPSELYAYEKSHRNRLLYYSKISKYILAGISGVCLMFLLRFFVLGAIVAILTILLLFSTYANAFLINCGDYLDKMNFL